MHWLKFYCILIQHLSPASPEVKSTWIYTSIPHTSSFLLPFTFCSLVGGCQNFGGSMLLLNVEIIYKTTYHSNPKGHSMNHQSENLKSCVHLYSVGPQLSTLRLNLVFSFLAHILSKESSFRIALNFVILIFAGLYPLFT
jgi:hypothetical protein